jgi:tetratricopeptide (TPR) repeat protein
MENRHWKEIFLVIALVLYCCTSVSVYSRDKDILRETAKQIEEGKLLYAKKDYYGAVDKWTEVLKVDPWNEEAKNLIRNALQKIDDLTEKLGEGFELLDSGKIDEAFELFRYVKENSTPKSVELYTPLVSGFNTIEKLKNRDRFRIIVEHGDELFNEGKYDDALMLYSFAYKFNPAQGALLSRLGEVEKTRMLFELKQEAIRLFNGEKLEESKKRWEEVLEINPSDEDAPIYLSKIAFKVKERDQLRALASGYFENGVLLYKRKQYEEAIDQFENAIAMNYRVEESRKYIETIRSEMARIERLERENLTEKVAYYLREGIKYYNLDQYRKSLSFLNEGLKIDPDNTQIQEYILRGIIALKREEEKEVSPTSPFYKLIMDLKRLGREAYEREDYRESIKYWEEILLIFPFNEAARLNLTKALSKSDPAMAREILGNMMNEAKELIARDKKREAGVKLRLILDVDPGYREAKNLLNQLESEKTEERRVVTPAEKKRSQELYAEGLEFYKKDKLQDAVNAWKQAVDLNPEFVEARVFLSRAETKLRNLQRLSEASARGTEGPEDELRIRIKKHYLDGINYYMNGMYKEAISEWEEVLKIDPENENVKVNIQRAKKRLGYDTEQGSS